jgi:cytochrome c556
VALGLALALVVALGIGLWPGSLKADDRAQVVAQRQADMTRMAAAMRVIGRFLKNEGATVAEVGASAVVIRTVATKMTTTLFPEGTAVGVGDSAAKPEIWSQWDVFSQYAADLTAAASRLSAVTGAGNPGALRAPIVVVVRSCSACHESFRQGKP